MNGQCGTVTRKKSRREKKSEGTKAQRWIVMSEIKLIINRGNLL
jgi:hypothetical protein